jgi:hypothetical protein
MEFAFHGGLSPKCGFFGKLNRLNRFQDATDAIISFPFCTLKSVKDTFRMDHDQRVIIKFLFNEKADARDIADRLQAQFDEHAHTIRTV